MCFPGGSIWARVSTPLLTEVVPEIEANLVNSEGKVYRGGGQSHLELVCKIWRPRQICYIRLASKSRKVSALVGRGGRGLPRDHRLSPEPSRSPRVSNPHFATWWCHWSFEQWLGPGLLWLDFQTPPAHNINSLVPNLGVNYPSWVMGPYSFGNRLFFYNECCNHNIIYWT